MYIVLYFWKRIVSVVMQSLPTRKISCQLSCSLGVPRFEHNLVMHKDFRI